MSYNLKYLYEFGPFRLDAYERILLRGGETVALTPKAFDLLFVLVERHGHLLEKEELLKLVWPDTFVEEANVSYNISIVRKALGDGENGLKYIETIPRRGYRFVAGVKEVKGESLASPVEVPPASPGLTEVDNRAAPDDEQAVAPPASKVAPLIRWDKRLTVVSGAFALLLLTLVGIGLYRHFKAELRVDQLQFKGGFYVGKLTEDEVKQGIEHYNQAIALDPNSAPGYIGLAQAYSILSDWYMAPHEAMPKAKAAALQALRLDEGAANPHVTLGFVKSHYERDWAEGEIEFKRAIELDPENPSTHQYYGWYLIAVGRFDEAREEMQRALELDPLNANTMADLGLPFYFARQYDQAIEQYRKAIEMDRKWYWSHLLLGWAYDQQGKLPEAIAELKQASRFNDSPQVLASLGHAYAVSGRRGEAQAVIEELTEISKLHYVSPYDVATIYAGLGDNEQAFAWLEKANEDRSGWLGLWLKLDPKFDSLRPDPRFRDLLRRIGLTS